MCRSAASARAAAALLCLALAGCGAPPRHGTLQDIDRPAAVAEVSAAPIAASDREGIRAAYADYLLHADRDEVSRSAALQRLAQLEFDLAEVREQARGDTAASQAVADTAGLGRVVELLETALRDYPHAADRDRSLYQLARAYDQLGERERSIGALRELIAQYPRSRYYVESRFRVAEDAFARGGFSEAEDLYTGVLVAREHHALRQMARYKRGWARFKLEYYHDAVADFLDAVQEAGFAPQAQQGDAERSRYTEYLTAIALSFSYLGLDELNAYFGEYPNAEHVYHVYLTLSGLYQRQERYTDAAQVLEHFIEAHPASPHVPQAWVGVIDVWRASGFEDRVLATLDYVYEHYHPGSGYWQARAGEGPLYRAVTGAIGRYVLLAASHHHAAYSERRDERSFSAAQAWYERYLAHYRNQARQANVHVVYAELLAARGDTEGALAQYEAAAFDGDIILHKDAAHAAVLLAGRLLEDIAPGGDAAHALDRLTRYAGLYARLYPGDPASGSLVQHAAREAYRHGAYDRALELAQTYTALPGAEHADEIRVIAAHAHFQRGHYGEAERAYAALLGSASLGASARPPLVANHALSIFNQGASALRHGDSRAAMGHFARVADAAPHTDTAPDGLLQAISLAVEQGLWEQAIGYSERFRALYPRHAHAGEVSRLLSQAYLGAERHVAAAAELLEISRREPDGEYRRAALWRAAELFEANGERAAAIRSYEEFAQKFPQPFAANVEAMDRLVALHEAAGDAQRTAHWRRAILEGDRRAPAEAKTGATRHAASRAALALARAEAGQYYATRLSLPLERSLQRKKRHMQNAIELYGRASSYAVAETATEAVHAIGEIYRAFGIALLESDRPPDLSEMELVQYDILLEDEAIPFEDKAIEFFELNMAYVKSGVFDAWVERSRERLRTLFPARYDRDPILEPYINVLH